MMAVIHIEQHPSGPRVRIGGQRIHHGAAGIAATVGMLSHARTRRWALLALLLAADDRHDWKHWFAPGDRQARLEALTSTIQEVLHDPEP